MRDDVLVTFVDAVLVQHLLYDVTCRVTNGEEEGLVGNIFTERLAIDL